MSKAFAPSKHQGMDAITISAPDGARATVMLQGGHVVAWQPAGGVEQLYCSPTAVFASGKAVRGGIPVCFPQFGPRGPLPQHGFARTLPWQLMMAEQGKDDALCVLRLTDSDDTRKIWPHAFVLELTVRISGRRIDLELACENTGELPLEFMAALHSYLRLEDLTDARLHGLQGLSYEDMVAGKKDQVETADALRVSGEVDRVYAHATRALMLREPKHALRIEQEEFTDVVVWNPWSDRCVALPDMPDDDYHQMLCVEAARINVPVRLAPGEEWAGRQSLSLDI
ncbi:glucose-6-phosphate 1-epimerase [Roseateles toxinivorans]|uniref:Putative glucose-6-phosphate 1-epimerase n=2 Tax=Roseateles toxinivorans TaxID=270368 RepID=A0A4V6PV40_9BURK|nr:glucose-6-phosphate 1-epimerase [Roseateles toxinivorans]